MFFFIMLGFQNLMIYNTLENDFWLMQITCFQIKKEQFEKIFIYMKSGVGSGGEETWL